ETLRIAYGDFINGQSVDTVVEQISILAECIVEAAIVGAGLELSRKGKQAPTQADGSPVGFVALALGKLGGNELNYSSDIDLIFVRETLQAEPNWQKPKWTDAQVGEYFERLGQMIIKILGESTAQGIAYRVDMRLRPHGRNGPLVVTYRDAISYYDSLGRTWERQAFVKARAIAGDLDFGKRMLHELESWIYRRYLMRADITGLVALKRRIEKRAAATESRSRDGELGGIRGANLKHGFGGIRDVEYAIQFLQLLHGADQPEVRVQSTLDAIRQLQQSGCITTGEQTRLEENYRFLRRLEHHLQIMFNQQTHSLPEDATEFEYLASRFGSKSESAEQAAADLSESLVVCTQQNRQILDHLLHNAFANHDADEQQLAFAESDLILDPEPDPEIIQNTLEPFGFRDCAAAYRHLQELARESIPFLSTRRSRHFLAAIARKLLLAISSTPDPDATLISLANVTDSLGGKAVLWELFSANPPSMELCLRLCATSPYLTSILTSHPGMIDELLDSLMLGHLPSHEEMAEQLDLLCRGAVEIGPMLSNFKSSMHLSVGVRDILGKATIGQTHASLADIAEVCMEQVIHHEFHRLVQKLGVPSISNPDTGVEEPAELVVLAVGKLGGREPNYHSDIDLIFLFDGAGSTKSLVPNRRFESTTNRHFFNQLCQRVIHSVTRSGPGGKLYDVDVRLRPLGRSGQLAISVEDLRQYFESGSGQIWERQALCKARPIWGTQASRDDVMNAVREVLNTHICEYDCASQIYEHRKQLEKDASPDNLKRGIGGTMDVEFVVQLLQLLHVKEHPSVIEPGTIQAIERLQTAGVLETATAQEMQENYRFLRSVESGIRLMNLSARHEIPKTEAELEQLCFLLRSRNGLALNAAELNARCNEVRSRCREIFESTFAVWLPDQQAESTSL
ncbi:MAG: bifunctional [glutamate--ammonia ligase]-adenylyl-L-tyrosine phosphorylase/[glutamate--ammonia-ligase] adenylyltransferase, partial [Planctomycetota bacterium]